MYAAHVYIENLTLTPIIIVYVHYSIYIYFWWYLPVYDTLANFLKAAYTVLVLIYIHIHVYMTLYSTYNVPHKLA